MVREKHHGPIIELNRIQVKRSRSKGGLAGIDGMKSVFGQMVQKLPLLTSETLALPHRVWKVEFVGEFAVHFQFLYISYRMINIMKLTDFLFIGCWNIFFD